MKIKERKSKKDIDPQTNNDSPEMYYKKRRHFVMNRVEDVCFNQQ